MTSLSGVALGLKRMSDASQSVSRVLSRTIIHLGRTSPCTSSNLPEPSADNAFRFLFGLAPSGVYLADPVARTRGVLLPRRFTLAIVETMAVYSLLHFP